MKSKYLLYIKKDIAVKCQLFTAGKKLISKLFVRHSFGDKRRNKEKSSIDCLIKLNEGLVEAGKSTMVLLITNSSCIIDSFSNSIIGSSLDDAAKAF